jgi:hypothetical protein
MKTIVCHNRRRGTLDYLGLQLACEVYQYITSGVESVPLGMTRLVEDCAYVKSIRGVRMVCLRCGASVVPYLCWANFQREHSAQTIMGRLWEGECVI